MSEQDRRRDPSGDGAEALGALVRAVADDWRMPPQTLGERTWRDRVAGLSDRRSRLRPAFAAIGVAVAATVVLALGGAWLTGRPLPTGASSGPVAGASGSPVPAGSATPSGGPSVSPSPSGPGPSPLPASLIRDPALAGVAFPVDADGLRILDLVHGLGSTPLADPMTAPTLLRSGSGTICLCGRTVAGGASTPTSVAVDLVERDASGAVVRTVPVETFTGGVVDPVARDAIRPVSVAASGGPDDRAAFLGWSIRRPGGWVSGVDIVDLRTGRVLQSVRLPSWTLVGDGPAGQPAPPTFADAPLAFVSPSGARIVIEQGRGSYAVGAGGILGDASRVGPDHWSAPLEGGRIGALTAFAMGSGTLDPASCPWPSDEALVSDGVFVATCTGVVPLVTRRVGLDGRPLGDVTIGDATASGGAASSLDVGGGIRYVWLPFTRMLLKLDVVGGRTLGSLQLPAPTADAPSSLDGLLARIGAWLTPAADAKVFLQPALAASPDGSRLYLLATNASDFLQAHAGSGGILVVDTGSMTVVARWAPLADYTSIAASRDGRYLYAAGAPGTDATGAERADQASSVTVYRAIDGGIAAIAGQLGSSFVTFDPSLVP